MPVLQVLESFYPFIAGGGGHTGGGGVGCKTTSIDSAPAGRFVSLWSGTELITPPLDENVLKYVGGGNGGS